jgi:DNA-binding XRE family transcriptional regulator
MHKKPEHLRICASFGRKVRQIRTSFDLGRNQFAEFLDCSHDHLKKIEKGKTKCSFVYPFVVAALMPEAHGEKFLRDILAEVRRELGVKPIEPDRNSQN